MERRLATPRRPGRVATIALWVASVAVALLLLAAGLPKVLGQGGWGARFANWGYPSGFVGLIGAVEVAGAVMLLVPKVAVLGAAILGVVMLGAAGTHLVHGETPRIAMPALLCVLLALIAWRRRPGA